MFKISNETPVYASDIDGETIAQMERAMQHHSFLKGAVMADAHLGYGLPIGGVMLCDNYVHPSYVGYDMGCGVLTVELGMHVDALHTYLPEIFDAVNEAIPMGFNHHELPIGMGSIPVNHLSKEARDIYGKKNGALQLGTLGGGNHFIEIGMCGDHTVYLTVHSGSRGVGHGIASAYMKLEKEGHDFTASSPLGLAYRKDLAVMELYAACNRKLIVESVIDTIERVSEEDHWPHFVIADCSHNHIRDEGSGMYLHRKGATSAFKGEIGLVPGNMRDGVCVVTGLGNKEGLNSCSHGAGRKFSRSKAKKELSIEQFEEDMEGITCRVDAGCLDEAPGAYKSIEQVMEDQKGLCELVYTIKPVVNWKG